MIVVVVHTKRVRDTATAVRPAGAGIQPLQAVAAVQGRKWIDERRRVARPIHAEIDVILRASSPAAATGTTWATEGQETGTAARTEIVNQAHVDRVAGAAARSNVMKILRGGIQVWQWNEGKQGLRRCIDERGIDDVEPPVALKLLSRRGIEDLHWAAILICRNGKISGTFGGRGYGGKRVVRRAAAAAVPPGEKKPLVAPVENFGDVQRTAKESAKARLVVAGFRSRQPCKRIRRRVQRGSIVRNVKHPMRLIDVEVARQPRNHDRSPAQTTGTASARAAPLQAAAFALRAVAKFLDALLYIVLDAAAKILCAPLRAADTHRFRRTLRSCAIEGKRRNVTAVAVLPTAEHASSSAACQSGKSVVQRKALKSAAGSDQCCQISHALLLLTRSQDHLGVVFSSGSFRLQHDFLRLRREAHEFDAHNVAAARQAGKRIGSTGAGGHREFLAGKRIGRGDGYARQRSFSRAHNSTNFK